MAEEPGRKLITDEQSFELAKLYYAAAKDAADALDARLFWSVAGVAAISAFAARESVGQGDATYAWLLIVGWCLLLLSILCLLIGYLMQPSIHLKTARYWLHGDEKDREATKCPKVFLGVLSCAATLGVVVGAACVMIYVGLSFWR